MADGQVIFEIEGDTRGIKNALRETTNAIDKESRKWEDAGEDASEGIGKAFTSMFKKISAAAVAAKIGQAILQIGKDAIQAASDLEEVQNVVDVTFGKSAKQVDSWAKNAIKQYGLTETQAKRFASTIGAMMKSLGMSGDEITGMSEALAGLAADMASFYNLDFDTAFAKIRSGISGETEPLKQLGINLSEANLEAFALTKNLEKAYKEMSSSEKAMLRYEYLMQATADAQGDFARTTDGLANGTRLLSSEMETLKTTVGKPLETALATATGKINDLIKLIMPDQKRETLFDQLNEIQVDFSTKETEITRISGIARELLTQIDTITKNGTIADQVGKLATEANKLDSSSPSNWATILGAFKDKGFKFDGLTSATGTDIKSLAEGLSGINASGYNTKAAAWNALLGVLNNNVGIISAYSGQSPDDVKKFLQEIAAQANTLDDNAGTEWDSLLDALVGGLGPGVISTDIVKTLKANMGGIKTAANALDANSGSNWQTFLNALTQINGLENVFGSGSAAKQNITDLANALTGNDVSMSKATAWKNMINAILKSESINGLSGDKLETVKEELIGIREAAGQLTEDDVAGWSELFAALVQTVPGVGDTPEGKTLAALLSEGFDTLSETATAAAGAMEWLDVSTGLAADDEERLWANIKALTEQFPELNKYVDFNAKKIKGGLPVLREYVELWEEMERNRLTHEYANNLNDLIGGTAKPDEAYSAMSLARAQAFAAVRAAMRGSYTDAEIESFINQMGVVGAVAGYRGYKDGVDFKNYNQFKDFLNLGSMSENAAIEAMRGNKETVAAVINSWFASTGMANGRKITLADGQTQLANLFGTEEGRLAGYAAYKDLLVTLQGLDDPSAYSAALAYFDAMAEYMMLYEQYPELVAEGNKANAEAEKSDEALKLKIDELSEHYSELADEERIALEWMKKDYSGVTDQIKETVANVITAIDAMEEYYSVIRSGVESSVKSIIKGFGQVETQATKAQKQAQKLEELRNDEKNKGKSDAELIKLASGDGITAGGMIAGLKSQLDYMTEYQEMLQKALEFGISPALLATLADGSQESYDYLDALLDKSDSGGWKLAQGYSVQALNDMFDKVQAAREGFVDELTQTQLSIDNEWENLVKTATDYISELDQYGLAFANTDKSMQGVLDALKTGDASLKAQVLSIETTLGRLSKWGIYPEIGADGKGSIRLSMGGNGTMNSTGTIFIPKHKSGLDYVPYDGYLAELHKGESVLTAQEAELYRNRGGRPGLDSIAGAIWSNAPDMGGDVYLDGRVVGRIISGRQANDYRALERSGWRG